MYNAIDSSDSQPRSELKRLARRDLPGTPRIPARTAEAPALPQFTPAAALGWVRSHLVAVIVLAVLGAALGYGYTMLATPKYTASTDLIIDPANLQVVTNDLYSKSFDQNAQVLDVESKLRVVTSGNVLRRVVDELQLQNDPEFTKPAGPFGLSFLSFGDDAPDGDPALTAADSLARKISAWREERSFVVTVAVSTNDPAKSVRIADAIVSAFETELAKAEADGASRAANSLMARLTDLQGGVTASEDAVESFKREHNLQESAGELVSSQSMAQINKGAVDAQQALITAQARYAELTDPVTGKANANAVQTETMVALRTQYGLLKQGADAAATTFGPLHPTRASAERQLAGLEQQIAQEAARAVQSAKLDVDQATRAVAQLGQQADAARSSVSTDDQAMVQLRELERDAKAKSDVYEAMLTRTREITEQQQLDTTNIRVISPATPPSAKSWPPRGVVMAGLGGAAGGGLGIALALGLGFLAETRRLRRR